jgi:hypothetical protein
MLPEMILGSSVVWTLAMTPLFRRRLSACAEAESTSAMPGELRQRGEPIGARGHLAEGLRAIGAVRTNDAQGRSRVPRRDGLEPVTRLVEPVGDVGPAESRTAASSSSRRRTMDVAGSAVGFSAGWSVPRSGLLTSVHLGNLR